MDKAKQLVAESGTAGQEVAVVVQDNTVDKSVGTYLQSVLSDLGYKASVKPISSNIQFTYIQNTNNNVQISVSQWYQDYPAASNFLNILFGCDSFHPGSDSSVNIAGFCDKEIDARMKEALKLAVTNQQAADDLWAEIDKAVMDKAPAVSPVHAEACGLPVEARRQFQVQRPILLGRHAVLGAVTARTDRGGDQPGLGQPRADDRELVAPMF